MNSLSSRAARTCLIGIVIAGLAGASPVAAAPCWPPPVEAAVVDPFRAPACRWCPGNRGVEYATLPGTAVRAVAAGRVTFVGDVAGRRYVVVRHPDGWRVTYGDLDKIRVERGSVVIARSVVGLSGARFHLGLRDSAGYRDPTPYLGRLSHLARLVPLDGSLGPPPGEPRLRCGAVPHLGDDPDAGGIGVARR
jgi:murein DD-endopeptidase MepM/ murein hydrolase activator NlpD